MHEAQEFIHVLLFINYSNTFHTNSGKPAFAPSCICGVGEHIFQDPVKPFPSVGVCQLLQGNQPPHELRALFLFNFVGCTRCCYGHTVLLRTKAKRAFFVSVEDPLPANPWRKQTCQLSPRPNYETPRKAGSLALSFLRTFKRFEGAQEWNEVSCNPTTLRSWD